MVRCELRPPIQKFAGCGGIIAEDTTVMTRTSDLFNVRTTYVAPVDRTTLATKFSQLGVKARCHREQPPSTPPPRPPPLALQLRAAPS